MLDGRLPYRDVFVEYPPGAVPLFAVPALAPGSWYDALFKVLMAACGLAAILGVTLWLARTGAGPTRVLVTALFLALVPIALGPVSLNTYDAWPAALTAVAVAALARDRGRLALGLLGAAAAAKLYAVLLVPIAVLHLWRVRGARAAIGALGVFAAVVAGLVAPWVAISPAGVWDSLDAQLGRGLHAESLGASVLLAADRAGLYEASVVGTADGAVSRDLAGGLPDALAALSAGLSVLAALAALALFARGRATAERLGLAFAVAVAGFLAFTKVLSPQYLVWLIPLAPLAGGVAGVMAVAFLVAALALAQSWYFDYPELWAVGPQAWSLLARNALLVALFGVLLSALAGRRARRPPRRRDATTGSGGG